MSSIRPRTTGTFWEISFGEFGEGDFDLIHVFATDKAELKKRLKALKKGIIPTGMIWVSWLKKSSQRASHFDEKGIRKLYLANGLVKTKVCALDGTWSGLKMVIRSKDCSEGLGRKTVSE